MRISFDWPQIYAALVSPGPHRAKNAFAAAREIESDIYKQGWPAGEVFGDQADLMHRYGFSRGTLREAVRLLEDRNVARMRRGPGGGLIVMPMSGTAIVQAVADYFIAANVTLTQLQQARMALNIAAEYSVSSVDGMAGLQLFSQEFRSRLRTGAGAGVLSPGRGSFGTNSRAVGQGVFTALFAACLDATERRTLAHGCGVADIEHSPTQASHGCSGLMGQGRAHELARKLAVELQQHRAGCVERIGTEDQLCERHRVSREVLRQAIRVLESHGLIESQRGRTHGLHAGAAGTSALIELVVAYFSSIRLSWHEFQTTAQIFSRIIRVMVAAESTPSQRQALLRQMQSARDWRNAPSLVTGQLHMEWSIITNPILRLMEKCITAYYARLSTHSWNTFDDSEPRVTTQFQPYLDAIIRGDLVQADCIVDNVCTRILTITQRSRPTAASSVSRFAESFV
jgi:DNA-binding FadR family transcriptional regulator